MHDRLCLSSFKMNWSLLSAVEAVKGAAVRVDETGKPVEIGIPTPMQIDMKTGQPTFLEERIEERAAIRA